jgi:hypothetical protein
MEISTFTLVLKTDSPVKKSGTLLRGFIGNRFRERPLLHHHLEKSCLYKYPLVQYKIIEGTPIIFGLNEGGVAVKNICGDLNTLKLGTTNYKITEKHTIEKYQKFGFSEKERKYRLITPWIALNEKNFKEYKNLSKKEQILLLHKILIGNILSVAKAFEYVVLSELKIKTKIKPVSVVYKGVSMIGFLGDFKVNFELPEFIGLGKGVSQGFGTTMKMP